VGHRPLDCGGGGNQNAYSVNEAGGDAGVFEAIK
tara:strand:+ start:1947 stop:2048 length:102 start_codon:yes stop_codon:yes gene_type:complete